jgi:uncharacterized membrane protein
MSASSFAQVPVAVYGIVLLVAAVAYYVLQTLIIRDQGRDSVLAKAVGQDGKGRLSPMVYAIGIGLSFVNRWAAVTVFAAVAGMWLIPDRRVERSMQAADSEALTE